MKTRASTFTLLLAIAIGLFIAGLTAFATGMATQPSVQSVASLQSGKSTFNNRCSSCHSIDSNGGTGFGPSLADIGSEASTRVEGMSRVQYIIDSISEPDAYRSPDAIGHMPQGTLAGATLLQAKELVTYVASLGAQPPSDEEFEGLAVNASMFEIEQTVTADLATLQRGESLFLHELGCNQCHAIFNNPGQALFAPSLGHAAALPPNYIRQSIFAPSSIITSGYSQQTIELNEGTQITGLVITEASATVTLLFRASNGAPNTRIIARDAITSMTASSVSTMPSYILSETDEDAIVAFLGSLSAEVPEP